MGNDKVCIVIVTYNGMEWLPKCLKSTIPYPVIVVDNNSSDETVDYIEKNYPEITLLKQEKNLGFGQANNRGISLALRKGAEYVFLLNQDAYLTEGCLKELVEAHKINPAYGVLSPLHLNGSGNKLERKFSNYVNYDSNQNFYSDFVLERTKENIYSIPFVNAAGWLISLSCLRTIGGFDPIFFHYGEDENYCQRMRYHQFKIGIVPSAKMRHDREERVVNRNKEFDSQVKERILKIKYGDINFSKYNLELSELIRWRRRMTAKLFIRLNFKAAQSSIRDWNFLKSIQKEIQESQEINKKKGAHYLNLQ